MPIRLHVDASDAIQHLRTVDGNLSKAATRAVSRAASQVEARIRPIINQVYESAVASTGGDFPSIYASHLRQGIQQLRYEVIPRGDSLLIIYDDIEDLGDISDLLDASHYHAILNVGPGEFSVSNPPLSEIGTDVGSLYGPNKPNGDDNRGDFFEAMTQGADYTVHFGKEGRTPTWTGVVSTQGMYEETLNARVEFWGNRYPEWIILDEGSPAGVVVEPTHFVEIIRERIEDMAEQILEQIAIVTFNEAVTDQPIPEVPIREPKFYRGGQFIPGGGRAPRGGFRV